MHKLFRLTFAAILLTAMPGLVAAQEAAPQIDPETQEILMEMQQLQQQISQTQQQVLSEPEIQARQQEVAETVRAAMVEGDPGVADDLERMEELQGEFQAAQQAGDQQKLQELMVEAGPIQQRVQAAQMEVIEEPAVAPTVEEFQQAVHSRMIEANPEAEGILDRLTELEAELAEKMPQAQ